VKSTTWVKCWSISAALRECPVLLLLVAGGCQIAQQGTLFEVKASLADSTCGTGALDAKDDWSFEVRLTKDGSTLTWYDVDSGATLVGSIGDGEFSVSDANNYVVTAASDYSLGCTVRRHDKYSGDAGLDSSGDLTGLDGEMVFEYSQATGYDCDSMIGTTDGFDDLPCEIDYTFVAEPD